MFAHARLTPTLLRGAGASGDRRLVLLHRGAAPARHVHSGNGRHALPRHAEEIWLTPVDHFDRNARKGGGPAISLDQILVESSRCSNRGNLKRRLFATGLKTRACELCGQGELWHGRRMSLIGVGRRYGVSDNAIRKWRRAYEAAAALEAAPREPAPAATSGPGEERVTAVAL
jgi:transposase-like protein